jgi:hypothetical protein
LQLVLQAEWSKLPRPTQNHLLKTMEQCLAFSCKADLLETYHRLCRIVKESLEHTTLKSIFNGEAHKIDENEGMSFKQLYLALLKHYNFGGHVFFQTYYFILLYTGLLMPVLYDKGKCLKFCLENPRLQHLQVFRRHILCIICTTCVVFVVADKFILFYNVHPTNYQPHSTLLNFDHLMGNSVYDTTYVIYIFVCGNP